jgi:hypothetical protein
MSFTRHDPHNPPKPKKYTCSQCTTSESFPAQYVRCGYGSPKYFCSYSCCSAWENAYAAKHYAPYEHRAVNFD